MSNAQYNIELQYKTTLTHVLSYPRYKPNGDLDTMVNVFRADSVIVDNSLIVTDVNGNKVSATLKSSIPNVDDTNPDHQYLFNNKILHIHPDHPDFINKEIPNKDITVRKIWRDQNGTEFTPSAGTKVEFELYQKANGSTSYPEQPYKTIELPINGKWEYTFSDLDARYEYEVREKDSNPLFTETHSISNTTAADIWVKATQIENGKSYLIASKNSSGNIVLLSRDSSTDSEDVGRFRSQDKVILDHEKGQAVTIDGQEYSDAFEYNVPSKNDPRYAAVEVDYPGQTGFALKNSLGNSYTRAERWNTGEKSGLMLTDWEGLIDSDRSITLSSGVIHQKLKQENNSTYDDQKYVYDLSNERFSSTAKTTSNYNDVYLYEHKSYTKEDPTHSVWTFTNTRRSDYSLSINKIDGETKKPIREVTFELYDSENAIVRFSYSNETYSVNTNSQLTTLSTNVNGNIKVSGLQPGTYYLKETKAPDGYVISDSPFTITIDADTDRKDGSEDMVINATIENHMAYELPETGSAGTKVYTATGTILLLTGTSLYRYKRRRRRKGGEAH